MSNSIRKNISTAVSCVADSIEKCKSGIDMISSQLPKMGKEDRQHLIAVARNLQNHVKRMERVLAELKYEDNAFKNIDNVL